MRRANSGATWHGSGLHDRLSPLPISIGASGRIVTQTFDASTSHLFTLDPATGAFSSLGTYALPPGVARGTVVEGSAPAFIYAGDNGTYRLPLPPAG